MLRGYLFQYFVDQRINFQADVTSFFLNRFIVAMPCYSLPTRPIAPTPPHPLKLTVVVKW